MRTQRPSAPANHAPRPGWLWALLSRISLALLLAAPAHAQVADTPPDEYGLKAAFLLNFASFTTWPAEHIKPTLLLCVYGDDPFGAHLEATENRTLGTRHLKTRRTTSVDGLGGCDVIFITRTALTNLNRLLDRIEGLPVLTIADSPGAMHKGVMLNMETLQDRIGFSANLAAARRQGLGLSSRLLNLAIEVKQ